MHTDTGIVRKERRQARVCVCESMRLGLVSPCLSLSPLSLSAVRAHSLASAPPPPSPNPTPPPPRSPLSLSLAPSCSISLPRTSDGDGEVEVKDCMPPPLRHEYCVAGLLDAFNHAMPGPCAHVRNAYAHVSTHIRTLSERRMHTRHTHTHVCYAGIDALSLTRTHKH